MESLVFDSADVGQVEAFLSQTYSTMRIGGTGPKTRARIARRVLAPEIVFDDLDYSFDIGYSAEAQDNILLVDVRSNTFRRIGEGRDETFGAGDQFLVGRPGLPYDGIVHANRLRLTVIDPVLLSRVATTGTDTTTVRLLDHRPVSRQAADRLRRATNYLRDSVLPTVDEVAAPLVISTAGQLLAAHFLQAFPTTAVREPAPADRRDAHATALHRAVAFIDSHADTALTVTDIAAAAHISPRALQYAFGRHLGTTPMGYLRRVRLDAAHQELSNTDPATGATVTTIAARWGFAHAGRFATAYRNTYGVPPSRTLRT